LIYSSRQLPSDCAVVIYGTGGRARKLLHAIRNSRPDITVIGFLDSFAASGELAGVSILTMEQVKTLRPDLIVIAAYRYDQIMSRMIANRLVDRALVYYDVNPPVPLQPDPDQIIGAEEICALAHGWSQGEKHFPDQLNVTLTTLCNCSCIFCAYHSNVDPKRTMASITFEQGVADALAAGMTTLDFSPLIGETLIDVEAIDKMAMARGAGIKTIKLTTNGTRLNMDSDRLSRLVDLTDAISISTPGLNHEAYAEVFRFKRYEDVIQGLEKLAQAKRANPKGAHINLCLRSYRSFDQAFQDSDFQRLSTYIKEGTLFFDPGDGNLTFDNWSGTIGPDDLLPGMAVKPVTVSTTALPCRFLVYGNATLLPEGSVRICPCRYLETIYDDLVIGNVNSAPLADILFNRTHCSLVMDWLDGRLPIPCRTCSLYTPAVRGQANP
jgi:hypothetical protein